MTALAVASHLVQLAGARPASEYAKRLDGLGEMV
jgi:hypothetical protein